MSIGYRGLLAVAAVVVFLPAFSAVAEPIAPGSHEAIALLRAHLERLDGELERRLEQAELAAVVEAPEPAELGLAAARLARHLRALGVLIERGEFGDPARWRERLRALGERNARWTPPLARAGETGGAPPEVGATITGRVFDAPSGDPLPLAEVTAFTSRGSAVDAGVSDLDGRYEIPELPAAVYYAVAATFAPDHLARLHRDRPCPGYERFSPCDVAFGEPIVAHPPAVVAGIDFRLERAATIAGRVTAADGGAPIGFADVEVYDLEGVLAGRQPTDSEGTYSIGRLAAGDYHVVASTFDSYRPEVFDGFTCRMSAARLLDCPLDRGTLVTVVAGAERDGIDFLLEPLGEIAGRVRDAVTGAPLDGASVAVYGHGDVPLQRSVTGGDGRYRVIGLLDGDYRLVATRGGYLGELFDGLPCPEERCDQTTGTRVRVAAATTSTADFDLSPLGRIEGRVSEAAGGAPVADVSVGLLDDTGQFLYQAQTDIAGRYALEGLVAGSYRVAVATLGRYVDQAFDGVACAYLVELGCDLAGVDPVVVAPGATVAAVDFALTRGASIRGTLREQSSGAPLAGVLVTIYTPARRIVAQLSSDENGRYEVGGLAAGRYYALGGGFVVWEPELYHERPCPQLSCVTNATTLAAGTPIDLAADGVAIAIDFTLLERAAIAGRVTDSRNGAPLEGVIVEAIGFAGNLVRGAVTDATGRYRIEHLETTGWMVRTRGDVGHLDQLFPDLPCVRGSCPPGAGQQVAVMAGATTDGIDFALGPGGTISGRVVDAASGQPIRSAGLRLFDTAGHDLAFGSVDLMGRYALTGLGAGPYFVSTYSSGFVDEVYDDLPCAQPGVDCDPTAGMPIALGGDGAHADGIDFALEPRLSTGCRGDGTLLCLGRGRFEVRAGWRDFSGHSGAGHAEPRTDDTGSFWFFDSANLEVVIKVLDACGLPDPHFWVFAAGLTNVEVELTVTDTVSGETKVYGNALGRPFQPILDTAAFATCPAASAAPAAPVAEVAEELDGECSDDGGRLCLGEGRFEVVAFSEDFAGASRRAAAVQLTDDTGYFWFFDRNNVEVVVKALDACSLPEPRFWVFAAGLTNVAVKLRVTDLAAAEVREYTNPLGTPFQPILDTGAFATCP